MVAIAALILGLVVPALAFLWYVDKRPHRHVGVAAGQLSEFLEVLLRRGYTAGRMVVTVLNDGESARFIQFRKYAGGGRGVGIEFGFPRSKWAANYYESLRSHLPSQGIPHCQVDTGQSETPQFLIVDCGQDIHEAARVATLALEEVFGLSPGHLLVVVFQGVSARDQSDARPQRLRP